MELTQEDIVTKILSDSEIIKVNYMNGELETSIYSAMPRYDLNHFLKTATQQPSRWGEKYIFVK